jgi:hypothetical protein
VHGGTISPINESICGTISKHQLNYTDKFTTCIVVIFDRAFLVCFRGSGGALAKGPAAHHPFRYLNTLFNGGNVVRELSGFNSFLYICIYIFIFMYMIYISNYITNNTSVYSIWV